jgi:hypothetical protein
LCLLHNYQAKNQLTMNRRNFIIIGAAGIAAVSIPTAYYFLRDIDYDKSLAEPRSLALIWDSQTIDAVGKQYLLQVPGEERERWLVKRLSADASDSGGLENSGLEEKIKKDFEAGNTVIVDGWILSRTEARQCALFSITETK